MLEALLTVSNSGYRARVTRSLESSTAYKWPYMEVSCRRVLAKCTNKHVCIIGTWEAKIKC